MLKNRAILVRKDQKFGIVKGEQGLQSILQPLIDYFEKYKKPQTKKMLKQMKKWDATFENEYLDPDNGSAMTMIGEGFAKELNNDCDDWYETICNIYEKSNIPLDIEELTTMTQDIIDSFDQKDIQQDLSDAHSCILNNLPTPAVMLLQKSAEGLLKEFYKNKMGEYPPSEFKSTWGNMVKTLRPILEKENDPILYLLSYRKFERNTAIHAGSRYTSSEAIEIFYRVKELMTELAKKLV